MGCLFMLLMHRSFFFSEVQFVFCLIAYAFDVICEKSLPNPKS